MKVLHFADLHCGKDERRNAELVEVVADASSMAREEGVNLTVIVGDLFDESVPLDSHGARTAIKVVQALAAVAPVLILRGTPTHDFGRSLDVLRAISTEHKVRVISKPEIVHIQDADGKAFAFYCMPGMQKKMFTELAAELDIDMHTTTSAELVRLQLSRWQEKRSSEGMAGTVLLGHIQLDMIDIPDGERGYEPSLPAGIFDDAINPDIAMLGHVHFKVSAGKYLYARTPVASSMSDAKVVNARTGKIVRDNSEKGYFIHTSRTTGNGSGKSEWESRYHVTNARLFLKIVCDSVDDLSNARQILIDHMESGRNIFARVYAQVKSAGAGNNDFQKIHEFDEEVRALVAERGLTEQVEIGRPKVSAEEFATTSRIEDEGVWRTLTDVEKFFKWADLKGFEIPPDEQEDYAAKINSL